MAAVSNCLLRRFARVAGPDDGVVVDRPSAALPRERKPRSVLELTPDGALVQAVPGPADARVEQAGRWIEAGTDRLILRWEDGRPDTLVEVISCDDDVLELRVLAGSLG